MTIKRFQNPKGGLNKAMAKGFMHNGRRYSSRRAFIRAMRGAFAGLPYERKKKVRPVVIASKTVQKKQPKIIGRNWKDVSSSVETKTVLGPKETKTGKLELAESKQTYRVQESTFIDPQTKDAVRVAEVEEASRYTPSQLQYEYEDLGDGITQVNAIKDNRIVSSTATTITPSEERNKKIFYLQEKFEKWQRNPTEENRLSSKELGLLAQSLDVPSGGGKIKHYQPTMEKRITKQLGLLKEQSKRDVATRYVTFPQRTKLHITKSKGMKYENQDVINQILATELAHERVYTTPKKLSQEQIQQEMEDLLTGASKYRPDKNYNTTQLQLGTKVESEHTKRRLVAKDIAKDHLDEDPLYYQKLKKVEAHQPKRVNKKIKAKQITTEEMKTINKAEEKHAYFRKFQIEDKMSKLKKEALKHPKGSAEANKYWKDYYKLQENDLAKADKKLEEIRHPELKNKKLMSIEELYKHYGDK